MIIIQLSEEQLKALIKQVLDESLLSISSPPSDELLTRAAAAQTLDVSLPTLLAWEKKQFIKATRRGHRVYFKKSELLQ